MLSTRFIPALILVAIFALAGFSVCWSADYEHRFVRNYPPGFNGMWYYADRFVDNFEPGKGMVEHYRWDRFMSREMDITYPFTPIPYEWDYGTGRTFNLPDYNANNWPR
jgi:hypothetical protein